MKFEAVANDEIGFAMALFVSSSSRSYMGNHGIARAEPGDLTEGKRLFLLLSFGPLESIDEAKREALLRSALFQAFCGLWEHYAGDDRRASICARVLGFCCLMEKTRGALVEPWTAPHPDRPEQILLHPAVVQAVATTSLNDRGAMSERVLVADIQRLAAEITGTGAVVQPEADVPDVTNSEGVWPVGASETAMLIRRSHWARHSLGATEGWPQSLRTAVEMTLSCSFPMIVLWGPDLIQLYNDAYRDIMGAKHPNGLGRPTCECWPEVWKFNEPIYRRVLLGETLTYENQLFPITRYGYLEQAYFTLCYSPIRMESGSCSGVLVTVFETTARVRAGLGHGDEPFSQKQAPQARNSPGGGGRLASSEPPEVTPPAGPQGIVWPLRGRIH